MTDHAIRLRRNIYVDSVKQMAGARALMDTSGVEWGTVVTGTPANIELLVEEGFAADALEDVTANDLTLAVRGSSVEEAFDNAERAMFAVPDADERGVATDTLRSLSEAAAMVDSPDVAVISVAGDFAALEAHKALTAGMHVLLFSDNVPIEKEVALKTRAVGASLYIMGPGAGTAMIDGLGLGFANQVNAGPVGVVAAAGTGAQEAMSLIHKAGLGVTQVIGVGGRDMTDAVDGRMTAMAIRDLETDPKTEAILLVSKPPSARVVSRILSQRIAKPLVAALIGLDEDIEVSDGVVLASTLESGVFAISAALGRDTIPSVSDLASRAAEAIQGVDADRNAVRGLFSGGTLCYEAMTLISSHGQPVYSNTPLRPEWRVENAPVDGHICLDLGEEEYTRNRPHPMIDPQARVDLIEREGGAGKTAVVLIDVVLGYGSHPDPAAVLAPACETVLAMKGGPQVIAYVLGTDVDPQDIERQRRQLEEVGCLLAPTNARAAMLSLAIAMRLPRVSERRRPTA